MSDGVTENLKKFVFTSKENTGAHKDRLEVTIPEVFRIGLM